MADLAELGIRVRSEEVAVGDERLDAFAASAMRAEGAVESFGASSRATGAQVSTMNAAVRQQDMVLRATRGSMGLTAQEGLNLSRQFADVGVTAAMGMNPLMIALQQGPQLLDIFQSAAIRTGTTVRTAMAATGAAIWTALAPLLPVIAAIAAAAAVAAGAWAIASNEVGKATGDVTKGMGLAEEQLDRLEKANVKTSATMGDAFKAFGTTVKESVQGVLANELAALKGLFDDAYSWIVRTTGEVVKFAVGSWVGALYAIRTAWSVLPAALGDVVYSTANAVIEGIETLINGAITRINGFLGGLAVMGASNPAFAVFGLIKPLGQISFEGVGNPYEGQAEAAGEAIGSAFQRGYARGVEGLDRFVVRFLENLDATTRARVLELAGDPNKGRSASDVNSDLKRIQQYIESLNDQANTMGLTAIAAKAYEINARALEAAEYGLEAAVRAAGSALLDKMRIEAADMDGKVDQLEYLRLEGSLIGAGNRDRAIALAQLRERQRLLAAGVLETDPQFIPAVAKAREIAGVTEDNRVAQDLYNDSLRLTVDILRQIDDQARDAANGLADAYGQQGRALGELLTTMTDYQARLAEISEARDRMFREGTLSAEREAMFERDRSQATIGAYGNMISAARGYFKEGSDGYQALLVAEQIYRAFQFASAVQSMALGGQETALSIANSLAKIGPRLAAGAASMFEVLGPLAFPAVAAMFALMATLGFGGGKSGGGRPSANDNDPAAATDAVRANSEREAQGRDATASAMASKLEVRVTADRDGLNAYVVRTARQEAVSVAAPMVAAGAAGTKRDVMQDLQGKQAGNRRIVT